jgi:hypothetical protein
MQVIDRLRARDYSPAGTCFSREGVYAIDASPLALVTEILTTLSYSPEQIDVFQRRE